MKNENNEKANYYGKKLLNKVRNIQGIIIMDVSNREIKYNHIISKLR